MSTIAITLTFLVSCLGVIANCIIIVLVILTKQLNSPNRILLLHMSVVCLALSFLYLWALINNSIIPSYSKWNDSGDLPPSLAITTATIASSSIFSSSVTSDSISTKSTYSTVSSPSEKTKSNEIGSLSSFNDLLIHLFQPIGLWTISCINFDRYYAICSPLHYNTLLTTKKVTIFLLCGWLIISLTLLPLYVMLIATPGESVVMGVSWFRNVHVQKEWQKSEAKDYYYWFEVQLLLTITFTIFLPISLIIACNLKILTIANYQRHRIASAIFESVLSAQIAITHQKNPFPPIPSLLNQPFPLPNLYPPKPNSLEIRSRRQKASLIVFELVASVILLYCPYYVFIIVFSFLRRSDHIIGHTREQHESSETVLNIIIFIVQFLMVCAPAINTILYGFKNRTVQENIQNYWRKQKTKIELHYEIQARTPSTCGSRKASLTELTTNFPQNQHFQSQLKRQLSDFFFGTSSSLTSHLNDDMAVFQSNRLHRTPSDSFFNASSSGMSNVSGRRYSHQEFLSPNFDPLGKLSPVTPTNTPASIITSSASTGKIGLSHSTSKSYLLSNLKKIIVGSKNDMSIENESPDGAKGMHFPKILITKHSDSLLTTNSTSRRDSDIQQVAAEGEEEMATEEKQPLLAVQTHSLENVFPKPFSLSSRKFQTL